MTNLSHIIRSFNRFELKYLTPLVQAERFKRDLCAYLAPDGNGDARGAYELSSLYYDSPDYRFYWEKVDGIKFRRKLRIRRYGDNAPLDAESPVFVEIKQRVDRVTQKRRVLLPYHKALSLCNAREAPAHDLADRAVLEELAAMTWEYNLRPASLIRYRREAWVGGEYDVGLRVTFDTDLRYCVNLYDAAALQLDSSYTERLLFPADWAVIEIKVNERIPYWLTELVAAHNLGLVRLSKYCQSIERMKAEG